MLNVLKGVSAVILGSNGGLLRTTDWLFVLLHPFWQVLDLASVEPCTILVVSLLVLQVGGLECIADSVV